MRRIIIIISIISAVCSAGSTAYSQITAAIGPATYYFVQSNDNNLHYGINTRLAYDTHQILIDAGFRIFDNVTSSVRTLGYRDPENLFDTLVIINSVTGKSWELFLNGHYYFVGQPEENTGLYALAGLSAFYYTQVNKLSVHNPSYFPDQKNIDGAVHSSTQITFNAGIGAKYPLRHSSLFIEGKISFPTDRYLDYQYPIENSIYISIDAGIRITLKSHRNRYQRWDINLNPFGC